MSEIIEKNIYLENDLEVKLLSSKNFNKSALSIDLCVGSMTDKKAGTSHLLEHCFLYSNKDNLINHINSNQGNVNISTSLENVNYSFEIDSEAFDKSLSLLTNYFENPSFIDNLEKQKKIIDYEFKKNLEDPFFISNRVLSLSSELSHPYTMFHHGNLDTLKDIQIKDLEFFYNNYYSSNLMKLVLLSNKDISYLEDSANKYFSNIKNLKIKTPTYNFGVFKNEKGSFLSCEFKSSLFLRLYIECPNFRKLYSTNPSLFITYVFNMTRGQTLTSYLKSKNYIYDLWSSFDVNSFNSFFIVDIKITEKGKNNIKDIIEIIYSYLNNLYIPEYILEEQSRFLNLTSNCRSNLEGIYLVKNLAKNMHSVKQNNFDYNLEEINDLIKLVRTGNYRVISNTKSSKYTYYDKIFNLNYDIEKIILNDIEKINFSIDKNKFIPNSMEINGDIENLPTKIFESNSSFIWFMNKNLEPSAYINLYIKTLEANKSPRNKLISIFYIKYLNFILSDISDEAGDAGLSFGIERDDRGIFIFSLGYADKILFLIKELIKKLNYSVDKNIFNLVKEELAADYKYFDSYSLVQYQKYDLIHKNNIHRNQYKHMLKDLTDKDLSLFISNLYRDIFLEIYACGNLRKKELKDLSSYIYKTLGSKPLDLKSVPFDKITTVPLGKNIYYLESDSNIMSSYFEFGERSTKLSAIIQLGYTFLSAMFFSKIREDGLAYIVDSKLDFFEEKLGISFSISSSKEVNVLENFENFLICFLDYLKNMNQENLESYKISLINSVNKNNLSLEDFMSDILLTSILKGNLNYVNELTEEIKGISVNELYFYFKEAFLDKRRSITVYTGVKDSSYVEIKDLSLFKLSNF